MSNESIKIPFKIKGEFKIPDNIKTKSSKRIIAGYASIVELDVYDEIIPHEALKEGLKTLISDEHYANLMLSHSDIQVGKILKSWGKLKTHVDKKGLFIVAELRDDINAANDAWEMILSGEMRGFSIGGEVIKEHGEATKGGREWTVLDKINLFEVSICSFPANEKSGFIVISKSIKSYECECLDCGDTVESNEHCKDIECPSCGGEMRRVDRPGDGDKKSKSKVVTKSPTCRQEDETKDECVSRKIPEIMDEGYDQDQAVAMANSMCSTACSDKSKSCEIDSGAYIKELIDLANLISDEDEIKIEEALHKSLTKIEHHKNLVANIRQNKNVKEELSNDAKEKSEEVKIDMKTKEGCTMSKDKKEDVKDNIEKDESVEDDVKDTKSEETEESEETSTKEEEEDSEPAFNLNDVMQRLEAVEGTVRQILEGSEEEAGDEDEEDEEDYEEEEESDSDKEDKPDNDVEKENEESDEPEKDEEESGEKEKSVEKSKDKDDEEIKVLQKSISDKDEHIKELEKTVNKLNAKIKELEETEEPAKTVIKKEDDFDDDVEDDKVIVKRQGKEIFLDDWE